MIDLTDYRLYRDARKSSKGNQLKWDIQDWWYKADYLGYEGLAEYAVSAMLKHSSLKDTEYILYGTEQIRYKHSVYTGCRSRSFLRPAQRLITLNRLFQDIYGYDVYTYIWSIPDEAERMQIIVNKVTECTGIRNFGEYLCTLMELDLLFLNEDRHFHNIALIQDEGGRFSLAPVFDNGAALLSDTRIDYPLQQDVYELIGSVRGKTFSTSLEKQAESAEAAYGVQVHFSFSEKDIAEMLNREQYYDPALKARVMAVLLEQRRRYRYLFE